MKVTLMRVAPDAKVYVGEALSYPEPGQVFALLHDGTKLLRTSQIISVAALSDGTIEFNTLNSTYRMYEDDHALRN